MYLLLLKLKIDDGYIISSAFGGDGGPYNYLWDDGSTLGILTSISAGTYYLEIRDNSSCFRRDTIVLNDTDPILLNSSTTDQYYFNTADGSAVLNIVSGGTAPFSYLWSDGQTTATASNLLPGSYAITVTDNNNCNAIDSVTINPVDCSGLDVNLSVTNLTAVNANDGTANAVAFGSYAPYTYQWSNNDSLANITNLSPGIYTVTITDIRGCILSDEIEIQDYDCNQNYISLSVTGSDENGFQFNDGMASANVVAAYSPVSYLWSTGASSQTVNNLAPGTYQVTLTDALGCTAQDSITILEYDCSGLDLILNANDEIGVGYNNGMANVVGINGVLPYSYLWSNGDANDSTTNLSPGIYSVALTDMAGCTVNDSTQVLAYNCNQNYISISVGGTDENGFQFNDGTASANVVAAYSPITYQWNTGATSQSVDNLAPGNYQVTVTDALGCTAQDSITILEYDCSGLDLILNANGENGVGFNDGMANVIGINGLAPYSYLWSSGDTNDSINNLSPDIYSVALTDMAGCIVNDSIQVVAYDCNQNFISLTASGSDENGFQFNDGMASANVVAAYSPVTYLWNTADTSQSIYNLAPGNYQVMVTDALGCTTIDSVIILAYDCSALTLSINPSHESGFQFEDGIATAIGSNGVAPYSYVWSNSDITQSTFNLSPGIYFVTLTDQAACQVLDSVEIVAYDCSIFDISTSSTDQSYYNTDDGTAAVNIISGVAPYTYLWNTGQTSQSITSLAPGNYAVNVTASDNCVQSASLTINPINCNTLIASYTVSDESCYGNSDGSILSNVSGGVSPYTYSWNTGETTEDLTNKTAGNYSLVITDYVGCSITDSISISGPLDSINVSANISDLSNVNINDGAIDLTITGGSPPYSFFWATGETTEDISNLTTGSYWVIVYDSNNCSTTESFVILVNSNCQPPVNLSHSSSNNGVVIFWDDPVSGADNYAIEYRIVGANTWNTNITSNTLYLNNTLSLCTDYEFRLKSICGAQSSGYTPIQTFSTTGCPQPCPSIISHLGNSNIISDNYQAAEYIESDGIVLPYETVNYQAGNYIILTSGFDANSGANFEAVIEDCD